MFSGKFYSGKDLINNRAFVEALNKCVEESITKCLNNIGIVESFTVLGRNSSGKVVIGEKKSGEVFDNEAIDDLARILKR